MNTLPLVLVQRTQTGAAVRYSRYVGGKSTHIVETPEVPIGTPVVVMPAFEVEQFRMTPDKFLEGRA